MDAAQAAGRTSAQGVRKLVVRFNRQGLAALDGGAHGGGTPVRYDLAERERILQRIVGRRALAGQSPKALLRSWTG